MPVALIATFSNVAGTPNAVAEAETEILGPDKPNCGCKPGAG